ncbi:LysR family transcriptional regulator [Falsirhodobacter sp. 20TX0035]|uniref:LysR family transcriptional regulator n=1 Tax=Falsirhodobacter sp. 20TX0035 TaxID=3022019 RepID=UPI00232C471C|nr:LysR family transcriptional regulator [Falsirhodobacter sp. 20TX0035]MDB6452934.1 LysR family transcriptional regulator [Falsirhodobacter sp. 20TX0035]
MTERGGVNPADISLRMLEIFATMMRCATTVEAAEALKISQPAISAGLRQLETQLDLVLFDRTARRLTPTAEARALYEEIRPIFGLIRGFAVRAQDMKLGLSGRLRIISTPPLGHTVGPRALERLLAASPDISVSYDVRRLDAVLEAVQSGTVDIGIALTQERSDLVDTQVLQEAQMVALVPADSPLAARPHVAPADLAGQPLIGLEQESNLGRLVRSAFDRDGEPYAPRVEVRYCETATMLVNAGLGVTVVDPWSARLAGPGLVERPFLPPCAVRAVLFTRKGVPHTSLMDRFTAQLHACLNDPPSKDPT